MLILTVTTYITLQFQPWGDRAAPESGKTV